LRRFSARRIFPQLKAAYIDTGKARFIFREFSRNTLDVAGFLLARCLGDDKAFAADETALAEQDKWAFADKPLEPLIAAMRPTGLTQEKATECLKNQKLADGIVAIAKRANDDVKLTGTPTFVHRRQGLWRRTDPGPAEGDPRPAGEEVGVLHQARKRRPASAPTPAHTRVASGYQVATNSGESSGQCEA